MTLDHRARPSFLRGAGGQQAAQIANAVHADAVHETTLIFCDQAVRVRCPASLSGVVDVLFGALRSETAAARHEILIAEDGDRCFFIERGHDLSISGLTRHEIPGLLMEQVIWCLTEGMAGMLALHAGAVALNGKAILIPGLTGAGKSSLVAWFAARGFDYLSDEITALVEPPVRIAGLSRAIITKHRATERIAGMAVFDNAMSAPLDENTMAWATPAAATSLGWCSLIIFPRYVPGVDLSLVMATPAQATLGLLACNVNARNLRDDGFAEVTALARTAPAVVLTYGDFGQLDGAFDVFSRLMSGEIPDAAAARFLATEHFRALIGSDAADRLFKGIVRKGEEIAA
jgi:hypothetical protein